MTDFRSCYPLALLLLFTLSACNSEPEKPTAEQVEVSLQEVMTIDGGEGMDGGEPLLGRAYLAVTDPQGNHFILDSQSMSFVKYNAEGNYLTSFGREGSGPGEFKGVFTMFADSRGRLIISDGGNSRITVYDGDGTFLLNEPLHGIQSVRDFSEMDDGRFLVAGWHPDRERMLHIMNSDFSEIEASLIRPELITEEEDARLFNVIRSQTGTAEMLDNGRILFAPEIYAGKLYLFEEEGEAWALADTVSGWSTTEKPIRSTDGSSAEILENYPTSGILSMSIHGDNMSVVHTISFSHGLYQMEDGSLLHLSYHFSEEEELFRMVLEQFDPETAGLLRFGTIPLELSTSLRPRWVDRSGAIYLTHNDSLGIRKVSVEGLN